MNKKILLLFVLLYAGMYVNAQDVILKRGMHIKKSIRVKKSVYRLAGFDSLQTPVILIEGNNLVIDFNHAQLNGNTGGKLPDEFTGVAIIIRNSRNITIRNLDANGYKVALLATGVEGLKIEQCDFSYNYRQHLNSTGKKEDMSDWMSYHHNENDQWLRYGAAIYLKNCNGSVISGCKVTGGQNALMMTGCNNGYIYNNDFSFNSGIGIGMYQSNHNRIMFNRVNFNVRGYSHGVYNRGQDSAGFLVYEQSSNNLFYNNSATHGGDGFFLWAGQTTMDTGTGGCNGNKIIGNDFSFAPANGIEATFSSNQFISNRVFECDYGFWGGYSYETLISSNQFRNNRVAVAIEHGQHNRIENNIFYQDREAIRLWSGKIQQPGWGYAINHDTRSVDYQIALNSFNRNPLVFHIMETDSLRIFTNTFSSCGEVFRRDTTVTHLDTTERDIFDSASELPVSPKNSMDPFKGNGKLAGRQNIMITEWGPYDFRYPVIWHTNPADTGQMEFRLLGPAGNWKIVSSKGLENMHVSADTFPATITAWPTTGKNTDIELSAAYTPRKGFTDQFGKKHLAGKTYQFAYRDFFQPISFTVSWYAFDSLSNPLHTAYKDWLITQPPFDVKQVNQLDYSWWGGIRSDNQLHTQFLTVADGTADIPEGDYVLGVTWDDAIRVYVDGKLLIDAWDPSLYQFDESPHRKISIHLGGRHQFRVEHVELGGFATLSLKLERKPTHPL